MMRHALTPSFEQFREVAGQGNVVPIYREFLVDRETPVSAFLKLGGGAYSFLLESMEGGETWGRFSMIGVSPSKVFELVDGTATLRDRTGGVLETRAVEPGTEPLALLHDVITRDRPVDVPELPRLSGGAVGYVSYDVVRHHERLPEIAVDDIGLPHAAFIFFDTLIIFDNLRHTVKVVANARIEGDLRSAYDRASAEVDELATRLLGRSDAPSRPSSPVSPSTFTSTVGRERYLRGVERIREFIRAGDVFQTVLSHRLQAETSCDPFDAYRALRITNPSPYMYYLNFGDHQVVGSSPEVLVRAERGRATVRPIAGTRPRGQTDVEDRHQEADLLADEKERSEHLMLVDLGRNDLGRVSLYGTVHTDEFMSIERYSHVMHLVSNVTGTLRPDVRNIDLLAACSPAGTLSGAPKVRAMEIIESLEPHRRGLYGGAVGYFDYHGNMDMCIAIRTLLFKDGHAYIGVGAGIVADSQPEREWEETMAKSQAMVDAVAMAERGLDAPIIADGGASS